MTETTVFATQQETAAVSVSPDLFGRLMADCLTYYKQEIASLREREVQLRQELTTLALPADLQDALAKTTLQPATRHLDLPLTREEAEAFMHACDEKSIPAYFLNNNDTKVGAFVNDAAKKLVSNAQGPAGPKKIPLETLGHLLATDHLPKQAGGRFPQEDFKNQQHLLGLLARNGLYNSLGTEFIYGTNTATATLPPYHKATVHARHAFSPHTGEYVWTVCTVSGTKRGEALDQQTYDNARNGGKLVFPLPEDINDMVQERSAIVTQALAWIDRQKSLRQAQEVARLRPATEPTTVSQPVNDEPQFRTADDLKKMANLEQVEAAIASARFATGKERMELVKAAYDFGVDVWSMMQRVVKQLVWGKEIPGDVSVSSTTNRRTLADGSVREYPYTTASTGRSTRTTPFDSHQEENTQEEPTHQTEPLSTRVRKQPSQRAR